MVLWTDPKQMPLKITCPINRTHIYWLTSVNLHLSFWFPKGVAGWEPVTRCRGGGGFSLKAEIFFLDLCNTQCLMLATVGKNTILVCRYLRWQMRVKFLVCIQVNCAKWWRKQQGALGFKKKTWGWFFFFSANFSGLNNLHNQACTQI